MEIQQSVMSGPKEESRASTSQSTERQKEEDRRHAAGPAVVLCDVHVSPCT